MVARQLSDILAALPADEREAVEARGAELVTEIDGLRALRGIARRTQTALARSMGVKQPQIAQIEQQSDLYLSTLRRYVEAAGGELEVRVTLPGQGTVRLEGLGELRQTPKRLGTGHAP